MKLLFDRNLAPTLVARLADFFPWSARVLSVLRAHRQGRTLCDKRADFVPAAIEL
ncbi:MAG: hypothetical protein ABSF69_04290 [Polyangiaceae bacterium]